MAKKEKVAKPAKVKAKKKPQFNAEQGGIGKLFQQHGEKMAFGGVILATGALIYLGWSASTTLSPNLASQSPKRIRELAQQAKVNIEKTDPTIVERPPALVGIISTVTSDGYRLREVQFPYPKPTPRTIKPRKDPKLFPPIKPEVTSVTGPVAKKKPNPDIKDRIALLKDWAERQSNDSGTGPGGPGGPGAPGGGGKSGGPGGPGGPGGGGAGMGGPGGMMGAGGGNLVGLLDDGYQPIGGDAVMPETAHAIVVKFLVPNELQVQEYKNNFDGTDEQSQPLVMGMQVQRALVTGPNDADLKWELVASNLDLTVSELVKKYNWEGVGPVVADPSVLHENLTMPMPPFISRNFYDISLHSETPKGKSILSEPEKPKEEENKGKQERKPGEFKIDPGAGSGLGNMAGGPPGPGGSPYGGGRPGGSGGNPYGGGRPGGRPGGGDGDGDLGAGGGGGMGMGSPGGMGMGSPRGMGGGGGGMYGGGGGSFGSSGGLSKYYLLRYSDVDVEPGKYYRYRVRVVYEDPNKPQFETFGTRPAAMDESVLERLHEEQLEREKEGNKDPFNFRFTDWSEPTPAAKVVEGNYAFAGQTTKSYANFAQRIPGLKLRFFGGAEPAVQMIPVAYDATYGCDVYPAAAVEASRGAVLDVGSTGVKKKIIHPISREAKELNDYPYNTGITVVDILGGETTALKSGEVEALLAPVDVMLVDQSGRVMVRTDMGDDQDFHKFVEREEAKRRRDPSGGMGGPGGPGGMGGYGGAGGPGDSGGGKSGGGGPGKQ